MFVRRKSLATERRTLEQELGRLPECVRTARVRLARMRRVANLPERPRVLDLGSASGVYVAAFTQIGCECIGVEPWEPARRTAEAISEHTGIPLTVVDGTAERIPFERESFDVVYASSVIEHVSDVNKSFGEINRVLRTGGVFWFSAASSMCPFQPEIRGFPMFGWYPDSIKRRAIEWAKSHKPELIGWTETPAINWFTPRKARRMLLEHGFHRVYDRWDLRSPQEGGNGYKLALKVIKSSAVSKLVADLVYWGCSFVAVK